MILGSQPFSTIPFSSVSAFPEIDIAGSVNFEAFAYLSVLLLEQPLGVECPGQIWSFNTCPTEWGLSMVEHIWTINMC